MPLVPRVFYCIACFNATAIHIWFPLPLLCRPSSRLGSRLLYVRDRYLRVHELQSGRDHPLVSLRRPGQSQGASLGQGPRSLQHNAFNPAESNVLVRDG